MQNCKDDIMTCDKERLLPANLLSIPCNSSNKRDLIMMMNTSLTLSCCLTQFVWVFYPFGWDCDKVWFWPGFFTLSLPSVPSQSSKRILLFLHQENRRLLKKFTWSTTKVKTGKQDTSKDWNICEEKIPMLWRLPQRTFVRLKKLGVFFASRS